MLLLQGRPGLHIEWIYAVCYPICSEDNFAEGDIMSRGLLVFARQIFVCLAVALLGAWTLFRPKSFQAFVHENFGIFPSVKPGIQPITILIRLSSAFLLCYVNMLAQVFGAEILFLVHIVQHLAG
jgi:hypothetical protein